MSTKPELITRIRDLELELEQAKAEVEVVDADPYPVGTILVPDLGYPWPLLIKVGSIHKDLSFADSGVEYAKSHEPRWVSMHGDMSGSSYRSLGAAKVDRPWQQFHVAYNPYDHKTVDIPF